MFNEVHSAQRAVRIRDIIDKMRHDGGRAERSPASRASAAGRCRRSCCEVNHERDERRRDGDPRGDQRVARPHRERPYPSGLAL